jgi:hypothetical protein
MAKAEKEKQADVLGNERIVAFSDGVFAIVIHRAEPPDLSPWTVRVNQLGRESNGSYAFFVLGHHCRVRHRF